MYKRQQQLRPSELRGLDSDNLSNSAPQVTEIISAYIRQDKRCIQCHIEILDILNTWHYHTTSPIMSSTRISCIIHKNTISVLCIFCIDRATNVYSFSQAVYSAFQNSFQIKKYTFKFPSLLATHIEHAQIRLTIGSTHSALFNTVPPSLTSNLSPMSASVLRNPITTDFK